MGLLDDLLGNTAADASKAAAADTYAKQQAATQGLQGAGAQYATQFGDLGKSLGGLSGQFQPWQATGGAANDAVRNLISNPSSLSSLPGYQFGLDQGNKSILAGNAATGNLFSGATGKALQNWGVNYADKTYGDQLSRLLGVSNQGLDATGRGVTTQGAGIGMQGQGLSGQLGANTSAYQGNMNSAGTIGQGDVAAANAKQSGIQNLFNLGGFLGGSYLGGNKGGGGFGNMFGSLFGGGSPSGYGR